jgi:hypothetical protein
LEEPVTFPTALLLVVAVGCGGGGGAKPDAGGGGAAGLSGIDGPVPDASADGSAGPSFHVTLAEALPASIRAPVGVLIAVDASDTAIVVTPSSGTTLGDPGPTITWLPLQGSRHALTFANATTPNAMTVDRSGAIWLVGQLYQPVSFGGQTLQPIDNGYYLAKLSPDGTPLATVPISRTDTTFPQAIAADGDGNVYVTGSLLSTSGTVTSSVFLTKFSSSGTQVFDQKYVGTDTEASAQGIAFRSDGDVVLAGFFNSSITFGTTHLSSAAGLSSNGFVAIVDHASGAARSAFRFGGATLDSANSAQVTSTGALRIAGQTSGSSTIGGMTVQAAAQGSAFIAELTDTGAASWVRLVGAPGTIAHGDTNAADRTFGVGHLDGASTSDAIVATAGADGEVAMPLRVSNADGNGATYCAADLHGGVWVAGEFQTSTDFGTGPLSGSDPTLPTNFLVHLEP